METKIMPKRLRNAILSTLLDLDRRMKQEKSLTFGDIYKEVCKVIDLQKGFARKPVDRELNMPRLLKWAQDNGVDCSKINIAQYGDYGFGLQAAKDIKKGESFLKIPSCLILSPRTFLNSDLGNLIQVINPLPGVNLSLALLVELHKQHSFWEPYINTLQNSYAMLLYYNPDEMELLCDTTLQSQALKLYQIVLSQYIQIYKLMEEETDKKKLWPIKNFCFEDFRWAVSTTMTRQNFLEMNDGIKEFVLIPLWDMCNHSQGEITTNFVYSDKTCVSEAMMDFEKGDQILIHYGNRSLTEMFLYGGYIVHNHPAAQLPVKIHLSLKDVTYPLKLEILEYLGMDVPYILKLGIPLMPKCLAFARIFKMTKELLNQFLESKSDLGLLGEASLWVSIDHEIEVWKFLLGRCNLTELGYKNTLQDDISVFSSCSSPATREIFKLRIEEKNLLKKVSNFCNLQIEFLNKCRPKVESMLQISSPKHDFDDICQEFVYPFICVGPICAGKPNHRCCHLNGNFDFEEENGIAVINDQEKENVEALIKNSEKYECKELTEVFEEIVKLEPEEAERIVRDEFHHTCDEI